MSGIRFSGALPEGERNGLASIAPALVECPDSVHVAVVLLDAVKLTTAVDSGDVVPTVRIRAIEPISAHDTDAAELRRLLRRAHERRTGRVELPLELESELESLHLTDDDTTDAAEDGKGDTPGGGDTW